MVGGGLGLTAESLDLLKAWLRSCLLDAYGWGSDCESLMKYVVALVKKDRSTEELRSDCLEQLKVFFNDNTQKFVNELFSCLESKAYLEPYGSKAIVDRSKKESDEQSDKSAGAEGLAFIVDKKPDPMIVSMTNKDKEREEKAAPRDRSRSRSRERSKEKDRSRSPHMVTVPRRRSRSPPRRSRSPPPPPRRFRSRSRSRSRERYRAGRKGRSRTPPPARHRGRLPVRHSRSRSRSPPQPLRDLRDTLTRKHNTSLATNVHITGRRDRCRDFDEQGFCIQGELCPYDHGADPVILDSTVPPPYNPTMRGGNGVPISPIVPEYNPLEPDMRRPHAQPHAHDHPVHPHPPGHHHLGPTSPYASAGGVSGSSWNYQPGPPTGPAGVPGSGGSHVQRELVAIPRNNLTQVQRTVVVPPHENHNSNARGGPLSRFQRGTELEVRRIPRQQNNIATLNEYFSKFGIITNIQVNFQGCAESALISFSKHHEANAAYRSTDAVLGNRFIRLFWHNPANNNVSSGSGTAPGGNQVPHGNNHNNNTSVLVGQLKKRLQLQQQRGVSGQEDIGAVPKKIAKPNPEALKKDNQADKSAQLISQKSRLIDKYVEENKRLLERLEKCNSDTEREQIKTMIANMTKIIEGLRPKVAPGALLPEITSEKQLLDAELDLYRQMQASKQGQNPAEAKQLEAKLLALRRQAKTLGLLDAANVWHGRLGHKGLLVGQTTTASKVSASGKVQPGQLAIDKRPRVVAILAGQLEMAGLCKHLSRYGKVANVAEEGEGDSKYFLFTFATRKDAEYAVNRGGQFRGAPLKWHWKEDPHAQFAKSTSLSKDIESREDSILDLKDQDDPAAEIGASSEENRSNVVGSAGNTTHTTISITNIPSTATATTTSTTTTTTTTTSQAKMDFLEVEHGAGVGPDGDHLLESSSKTEHKLTDNTSCVDIIKDHSALLEDEDDEEGTGETRSWRH